MPLSSSLLLVTALAAIALFACEPSRHDTSSPANASETFDAALHATLPVCQTMAQFEDGSCCWPGQTTTRDAQGRCLGTPSSCPEPLLVFPPEQRCDPCAGSSLCADALAAECEPSGQACYEAAKRYMLGSDGLTEDRARATTLMLAACDAGHLDACSLAALHLERGVGLSADLERAEALYARSCPLDAESVSAPGCVSLARLKLSRGELNEALDLLTDRCEAHQDASACSMKLNALMATPLESLPQAHSLTATERPGALAALAQRACQGDHPPGCTQLAVLLLASTDRTAESVERARELLTGACGRGHHVACLELAKLYHRGVPELFEPRLDQAVLRYEQACQANVLSACAPLSTLYLRPDLKLKALEALSDRARRSRARQLAEMACAPGEFTGCGLLAIMEQGGDQAAEAALSATRERATTACLEGATPWCTLLAEMQHRGLGGARDIAASRQRFDSACRAGDQLACRQLALQGEPEVVEK